MANTIPFLFLQMITIAFVSPLWKRDILAIHMIVENIDIRNIYCKKENTQYVQISRYLFRKKFTIAVLYLCPKNSINDSSTHFSIASVLHVVQSF
jgi:hypothetical protein